MRKVFTNQYRLKNKVRSLMREDRELYKRPKITKLIEPYQRGWKIVPDLRSDIKNRKDADLLFSLVTRFYTSYYTRSIETIRYIRRYKDLPTEYKKNKKGLLSELRLSINIETYNKMSIEEQKHCSPVYSKYNRNLVHYYMLNLPSYYISWKILPYMIDTMVMKDPNVISREKEIDNYMTSHKYYHLYYKGSNYSKYNAYNRAKQKKLNEQELGIV